ARLRRGSAEPARADGGLLDRGRARPPEFPDVPPLRVTARRGGLRTGRGGAVFAQAGAGRSSRSRAAGRSCCDRAPGTADARPCPNSGRNRILLLARGIRLRPLPAFPTSTAAELWSATGNRTLSEANMGPGSGTLAKIRRRSQQILTGSELTCSLVRTTTSSLRRKEFNDESRTASPARSRDLRIRVPVLLEVSVQTGLPARRCIHDSRA